ncbi:hypothetical protein Plhal304r1_c031g0100871 [Plasmopara halstedii]
METQCVVKNSVRPLDSRILSHVLHQYDGKTVQIPECDDPVYHGKGKAVFKTNFTYTGDFYYGRLHGIGRINWHTSNITYEGDVKYNEITGKGTYWWPNGSKYIGDVKCGKRHGYGVFETGEQGVVATKEEQEDKKVSNGIISKNEKEMHLDVKKIGRYSGEWFDGVPHGYGELVYDNVRNVRYEGNFVAGKRDGYGVMYYEDGSMYAGDWKDDVKHGHGVMTWVTLDSTSRKIPLEMYDGDWKYDRPHGFGRYVWYQSTMYDKNWYEGEMYQGKRHGRGVFYYSNGAQYEGEWKENQKDGWGLFFYQDGRVFVGRYHQDRSNFGVISKPNVEENGVMLYINDLFSFLNIQKLEQAQEAVVHSVLRLNTELRTLYREYLEESRQCVTFRDVGNRLELVECRKLLFHCGFYLSKNQLENFLNDIRTAQRTKALTEASSMNFIEETANLSNDNKDPFNFTQFLELLVRIASSWVQMAHVDGSIELFENYDNTEFLAEIFSEFYNQMMIKRHRIKENQQVTWLSCLRSELMSKSLHCTFIKHHQHLQSLYEKCANQMITKGDVTIQSLLTMLYNQSSIFTPDFQLSNALAALNQAFECSFPLVPVECLKIGRHQYETSNEIESNAFFLGTKLNYSDFLEAFATILYVKQHLELEKCQKDDETIALNVLVDHFIESLNNETTKEITFSTKLQNASTHVQQVPSLERILMAN